MTSFDNGTVQKTKICDRIKIITPQNKTKHRQRERERERDRQTETETETETDRQTDR